MSARREIAPLAERNRTVDKKEVMQEKRFFITNWTTATRMLCSVAW